MRLALEEARRALGDTSPNPMVGCVLVRDGHLIATGYHRKAGEAHAEQAALSAAGDQAKGATAYVNLEPCNHWGRTPPCTRALIAAGVARVVVGVTDPNPIVSGRGILALREAGVRVDVGVLEDECRKLNRVFFTNMLQRRPWVVLKAAITLDGKIATPSGDSKWITGPEARLEVHRLRAAMDAVLVGSGTVWKDDPLLTPREVEKRLTPTRRIVLSRMARLPPAMRLLRDIEEYPLLVIAGEDAPPQAVFELEARGAQVIQSPVEKDRISLTALMKELHEREIRSLLVEGGAAVHGSFWKAGLADQLKLFVSPRILGGQDAPSFIGGPSPERIGDAVGLEELTVSRFGADWLFDGLPTGGRFQR
ncbi:MAG: Riboflavin biosynthesis protein RibD [Myxococcota bacterium]|nr:Riboflavin biosynthesis protein RibD [Myxococcota bacterium]